jgi:hypothetical protein
MRAFGVRQFRGEVIVEEVALAELELVEVAGRAGQDLGATIIDVRKVDRAANLTALRSRLFDLVVAGKRKTAAYRRLEEELKRLDHWGMTKHFTDR